MLPSDPLFSRYGQDYAHTDKSYNCTCKDCIYSALYPAGVCDKRACLYFIEDVALLNVEDTHYCSHGIS